MLILTFSTLVGNMISKVILSLILILSFTFKANALEPIFIYEETKKEVKKNENVLKLADLPIGYLHHSSFTQQADFSGNVKLSGGSIDFRIPTLITQDYKVTYSQQVLSYVNQSFQKIYILHQVFRI